ncbi:MAG: DUF624 domain-containing protein [Tenericutes bacterium]|nr:DUF624 domain-containing protein [Mycoplasmatota bacterium]
MLKDFYKKAMDVVFVNFLWLITSLLGVFLTLGAATSAMFCVMFKIINTDESTSVLKEYWKSFKENFWFSTLVWLLLVILAVPIYFMYIYSLNNGLDILVIIAVIGAYQLIIFFIYFFPTLALFKTESRWQMIKSVLIMANKNLWTNFKVLGSLVFVIILVLYVHISFLVVAVGIYGFLVAFHLKEVFRPYLKQFEDDIEEEGIL